jgi:PAS domain S-box-containing protein
MWGQGGPGGTKLATFYALVVAGAGVAVLAQALRGERNRTAWALIGCGLLLWAAGDAFWLIWPDTTAYPSIADILYWGFYALALAGLMLLGGRPSSRDIGWWTLLSAVLGLATLWSWLVFGPVMDSLEGSDAAIATTLSYPLLDLLLVTAALFLLAGNGWRAQGGVVALLAGLVLTGIADSIWVVRVAEGMPDFASWQEPLWPIGALLIAAASWTPYPKPSRDRASRGDSVLVQVFAAAAILIACTALVRDHFERLSDLTVVLSMLTIFAAIGQLVFLYRSQAAHATRRQELEALLAASAEASLDAIITTDTRGHVLAWNHAAERIFGYSRDEANGRRVEELVVPPALQKAHRDLLERMVAGGDSRVLGNRTETLGKRADGGEFPIEIAITQTEEPRRLFTAYVRDISEDKRRDEERERLAGMVRSTEDALYSSTLDGVIIAWNQAATELYGYPAEEAIGAQMLDSLVPTDDLGQVHEIIARVSRGETVACEGRRRRKTGELVEVAVRYFPIRDEVGRVTGFTVVSRDITDRRRREREERANRERNAWRSQVEDALEIDSFEFHAQPVISLRENDISHHELLLRLRLDGDMVPPGRFLPHVESSPPLMRRIDRWAIRRGIELSRRGRVAINLSATSLSDAGVVAAVERALTAAGANPEDVIFEITETAAAENLDAASTLVAALSQIGCGVALDDFGTGYGSFTYLKHLAVTELKIDMEFIRGLARDPADQRVVRSIVAVARNFEIETVAEGVEDEHTLDTLRGMGVDCAQGYLLGRPSSDWKTAADVRGSLGWTP